MSTPVPVTQLLQEWSAGDRAALDRLVPLVYDELRRLAANRLRHEHEAQTIEPTGLVHEAYMRLVGVQAPEFNNRAHFLGIAARLMRQILVDRARTRKAAKRSGGVMVELNEEIHFSGPRAALVVALDDALAALEQQDPEKARILELRYFGGLTAEESAAVQGQSVAQINRAMRLGQAWLRRELETGRAADDKPGRQIRIES